MSHKHHIFHDPSGRRKRFLKLSIVLSLVVLLALAWYATRLFHSIPALPVIGSLSDTARELQAEKNKRISSLILEREREELEREIRETENLSKRFKSRLKQTKEPKVWAIYEPANESAYFSFRSHSEKVTDLILPTFYLTASTLENDKTGSDWLAESQEQETISLAHSKGIRIYARLTNYTPAGYDPELVTQLLENEEHQERVISQLISEVKKNRWAGLSVDFRNLSAEQSFKTIPFLANLSRDWRNSEFDARLGVSFQATESNLPLWRYGALFDFVLMQAWGENSKALEPGPVASLTWFNQALQFAVNNIPADKLVVMFDNSASDWADQASVKHKTYLEALLLAKEITLNKYNQSIVEFDPVALNNTFGYLDSSGKEHRVWFSDAANSYNQYLLIKRAGILQSGIWSLGTEDPGLWSFLGLNQEIQQVVTSLKEIAFPYEIQFSGRGDILKPREEPKRGERILKLDNESGLITHNHYLSFPSAVVVERQGFKPKQLALTFDDSPDQPFTEQLLSVLAEEKIKATFFVIGEKVQSNPALLKRIYSEGHDIGNHTFTHPELSTVSEQRQILELNSTQRLVQSILGRSLLLFRPPYISHGSPDSLDEVRVIKTASRLNYITVSVSADAQDWQLYKRNSEGKLARRTASELVDKIISQLPDMPGNAILFHDGPRDREETVKAVKILIPELRNRGYQFVSISQLLGVDRNQLMPVVESGELILGGLSRAYIEVVYFVRSLLEVALILVAAIGLFRLFSFIGLSIWSLKHEVPYKAGKHNFAPAVSVIVAAYNEEKVIAATIRSLLRSNYPEFEIIVVNDGSTDQTSQVVRREFGDQEKVRLLEKENGGKSSALNLGIEAARYDYIVGLDADTQYDPEAIAAMMRHFSDPNVGAVSGNVKVGNRDSCLLQCQSIEYITNQNFGRRAFSVVDAVTVVPGAAGAWRKSALVEVGLYHSDTLGEDMELTWRVRKAGYRIVFEAGAFGYTEAPNTLRSLFKQRFRWIYGQIQIIWKHRDVFFNGQYKWFGWFGAPLLLIDDIFLLLSPLGDLQALISIVTFATFLASMSDLSPEAWTAAAPTTLFIKTMLVYLVFFATEVSCAVFAFRLDKEPLRPIWLLIVKQFFYRQLMYLVTYKAVWRALSGWRQSWGVLARSGEVKNVKGEPLA